MNDDGLAGGGWSTIGDCGRLSVDVFVAGVVGLSPPRTLTVDMKPRHVHIVRLQRLNGIRKTVSLPDENGCDASIAQ